MCARLLQAGSTKGSLLVSASLSLYCILAYQCVESRPLLTSPAVFPILLQGLQFVPDVSLRVEVEKGLASLCSSLAHKGGSVVERNAITQLLVDAIDTVRPRCVPAVGVRCVFVCCV